jgi:phosphoglycerol transferase MdoB-like AlkP superfamily enzyme
MRRLRPSDDPDRDAKVLGPFAMLLVHGMVAKGERASRQQALAAPAIVRERGGAARGPVIIVQCESFFDARRVSPLVPADLLPAFDACCREGAMFGRLEVPGWGANTMRTEFAVLTGIPETELGYDRFNPYFALARVPIASQAWRLRRQGYRTICLHPFDRRFFRRDLAMPALGFEKFLGRETLGGSRVPPYCPDPDLAQQVLRILDAEGPQTFIFVITMENHGPWHEPAAPFDAAMSAAFDPEKLPQRDQLLRYLDGLRRSNRMLQILAEGLTERGGDGVLAFYGDHLPSFPRAFNYFGFHDLHSDYVIWPGRAGPVHCIDLPAHRLGSTVVDKILGEQEGRPAAAEAASRAATPVPIAALGVD